MGKRRTRKQKETAKHTFSLTWEDTPSETRSAGKVSKKSKANKVKVQSQTLNMSATKKDLAKSIIVFVVISGVLLAYSIVR